MPDSADTPLVACSTRRQSVCVSARAKILHGRESEGHRSEPFLDAALDNAPLALDQLQLGQSQREARVVDALGGILRACLSYSRRFIVALLLQRLQVFHELRQPHCRTSVSRVLDYRLG